MRNYYREKGIDPLEIEYVQVRRDSLRDIVEKLEHIYETNDDCHFHVEVTGGEDLILIGLGILCQRHPETELCQIRAQKPMSDFLAILLVRLINASGSE